MEKYLPNSLIKRIISFEDVKPSSNSPDSKDPDASLWDSEAFVLLTESFVMAQNSELLMGFMSSNVFRWVVELSYRDPLDNGFREDIIIANANSTVTSTKLKGGPGSIRPLVDLDELIWEMTDSPTVSQSGKEYGGGSET